jgi:hypothetical protein
MSWDIEQTRIGHLAESSTFWISEQIDLKSHGRLHHESHVASRADVSAPIALKGAEPIAEANQIA